MAYENPDIDWNLDDSVAVVFGVDPKRGIGRAILKELGLSHSIVYGTSTTQEGADAISGMLEELGIDGQGYVFNIISDRDAAYRAGSDPGSLREKVTNLKDAIVSDVDGREPNIVVPNQGITRDSELRAMSETQIREVMEVKLVAPIVISQVFLEGMREGRERAKGGDAERKDDTAVLISSITKGPLAAIHQANYAASNAGIEAFVRVAAAEYGPYGINVNAVAPGYVAGTKMTDKIPEARRPMFVDRAPLRRSVQEDEVAGLVGYLVSRKARAITGQTIVIDAGLSLGLPEGPITREEAVAERRRKRAAERAEAGDSTN